MRDLDQIAAAKVSIEPAGFFALRTPLLPFGELRAFGEGLGAASAAPAMRAAAIAGDVRLLQGRLRALLARPDVREAIFVASPSLDDSVAAWHDAPDSERGRKIERALVRYLARMAGRATPFGLFAGCSTGTVAEATRLVLDGDDQHRRATRLDIDYLGLVAAGLARDPAVQRGATYRPNTSLYCAGEQRRYVEAALVAERRRSYRLVAVDASAPLDATLERARHGATLRELALALVADHAPGELSQEEADDFVAQLADEQVLVPELTPLVTGSEPVGDLVAQLAASAPAAAGALDQVRRSLAALDAEPLGVSPARYRAIAGQLAPLPARAELPRLFQVDLVKRSPRATLGRGPVAELTRVLALLQRLPPPPPDEALRRFRAAFAARYEDRWVPACEALDDELGVGYGGSNLPSADVSPLLRGLAFAAPASAETRASGAWQRLLARRLEAAGGAGAAEIVLEEGDLALLGEASATSLPASFAVVATLAAASPEALQRGDYTILLRGIDGPSGANLLGRFCHADERLAAAVRAHLAVEEAARPDAIHAEIVHLPEGRSGNILLRPLLREYELALLGRSGAPPDRVLTLADLEVAIREGRVVLRCPRLGRQVIPRLSTAHDFARVQNLASYRFLCALQAEDGRAPSVEWGALGELASLPRLRLGRVVLSPQRWRLDAAELAPLGANGDRVARFERAQALRARRQLPRWVALADSDNELPVDLDNVLAVDSFVQLVHERPTATLTELFGHDGLCAHGPAGDYVHEMVIPMSARSPRLRAERPVPSVAQPVPSLARPVPSVARPVPSVARSLPPGSDWLYAKLYCGASFADAVLRELAPLVTAARAGGAVDDWFFVRYGDPEWHVRVRLHGEPRRLAEEVSPRLLAAAGALVTRGLVWRVQLDTYEREVERYGGARGILLAEQLFAADSDAVLELLATLDGDAARDDARWRLSLRGIDQLLDDVGLSPADKYALAGGVRARLAHEHRADARLERQLGERYRVERAALETLLDRGADQTSPLAPQLEVLARRSQRLEPIVAALRACAAEGELTESLPSLADSFAHMHANRVLRGAARAHELVLYDFLERLYGSELARARRRR
ncbi:MAG: Lanthionine biosynthesis protein LanB [Myxococcales bacterium]|nr:Lanthionine biosynthesis protein LanB [Myxococcales bacterium]